MLTVIVIVVCGLLAISNGDPDQTVVTGVDFLGRPVYTSASPVHTHSTTPSWTTAAQITSYTYPAAEFTEAHRGCFTHGSSFQCANGADCTGQFYPDLTTCLDNWQAWWVATQAGSQPEMPSPVWVLRPGSDTFPCLNLDISSVVSGVLRCSVESGSCA